MIRRLSIRLQSLFRRELEGELDQELGYHIDMLTEQNIATGLRGGVLAMVIREGLMLVTIGLAIGIGGALVLTKLLGAVVFEQQSTASLTLLVGTEALDALTYIGVAATLLVVAIAACVMPARRAASVDPMVALRAQ